MLPKARRAPVSAASTVTATGGAHTGFITLRATQSVSARARGPAARAAAAADAAETEGMFLVAASSSVHTGHSRALAKSGATVARDRAAAAAAARASQEATRGARTEGEAGLQAQFAMAAARLVQSMATTE